MRDVRWLAALVFAAALTAGCAGSSSGATTDYYVSLGDSYSVGYQPRPVPAATSGYTAVVASATGLRLANFGCGGATTTSILRTVGCSPISPPAASDAVSYPTQTQAAAAEAFIRAHAGHIGLVTVSIGGNDVTHCASQGASAIQCLGGAITTMSTNVRTLVGQLRAAAGPKVPILGLTYPDVLLGLWVFPQDSPNQAFAKLSVTGFQEFINPALKQAYASAGGVFVDITAATGAYTPLSDTTTLAPYGQVPTAVAQVCGFTWYCQLGNIHANTTGYNFIGEQVVSAYDHQPHHSG
jgi:lysophospholipase L1-like esterase